MSLNRMLREIMKSRLALTKAELEHYDGPDWWQLAGPEADVFELDRERWPALVAVWQAFEFFTNATDGWNDAEIEDRYSDADAFIAQARNEKPEWVSGGADVRIFMRFAAHFTGLSCREADALFAKMRWWTVRAGVMMYRDEQDRHGDKLERER